MQKFCGLYKLALPLLIVWSQCGYAEVFQEEPVQKESIFIKNSKLNATQAAYTFSSASGDSLNYIEYCFAADNTCGSCATPILFTPLSNPLPYGSYTVSSGSLANLLKQTGVVAGAYNIGMSVLSTGLDCASGAAYCKGMQDSNSSNICLNVNYNGSAVTSVTQNDNGNIILDSPRGQYLYVVDRDNSNGIISCSINSSGSVSSNCTSEPSGGAVVSFGQPYAMAITTIDGTQYAYVAGQDPTVITACEISSSGGGFVANSCVQDTSTAWWSNPNTITIATHGDTQYAYITDQANANITKCTLNIATALDNCTDAAPGQTFSNPVAVTFSTTNNVEYAYIADAGANTLLKCALDSEGTFSNCVVTGNGALSTPGDIKFTYATNNTKYAYVADRNGFVIKCNVSSDGELQSCQNTPTSLSPSWIPMHISFSVSNGQLYAYVTDDFAPAALWQCAVQSDGALASCSVMSQLQDDYGLNIFRASAFSYTAPSIFFRRQSRR